MIDFQTHPDRYRHWRLTVDGPVARLDMDVDPDGGLAPGYELKSNSYDLGVDIELADAVQRLRFEHPEVGAVVIGSHKERMFCAGANIGMLASSAHPWKVNFCKFTNETRNAIEDASAHSGQRYLSAINGTAAGGGYELALATDHIMLIDDGAAAVALPEVPLLGVLPGTGGLTRLIDKRGVRRDRADVFCTVEEGIKGSRAEEWKLVDELVRASEFERTVAKRAEELAASSDRPSDVAGVRLSGLDRRISGDEIMYSTVGATIDRETLTASIVLRGPSDEPPPGLEAATGLGSEFWPLCLAREFDDLILHLRMNELEVGTWLIRTKGDIEATLAHNRFLLDHSDNWFGREVMLLWKRVLKRLDVTSRSIMALVEPGSCFAGFLAEVMLAADRAYMLDGPWESEAAIAELRLTGSSTGPLAMSNDLSRLETRFWGDAAGLAVSQAVIGDRLDATSGLAAGLVTDVMDDLDWEDELRVIVEERMSFSPDGLTGLEANLRFPGPETLETKIFGRLSAWQNWVFQRPNASGEEGVLRRYGSGRRPVFDTRRV